MKLNENYARLKQSYLFSDIAHKVAEYANANPGADIIKMGIGDVTLPLAPAVISALQAAVEEMGDAVTFRGYGPEQGYDFLRLAIQGYYASHGVELEPDEIFVSDGAKSDVGNILDLFDASNTVLTPDPVYPVYVDTNIMAGRTIRYINGTPENGFLPLPDESTFGDLIYICSPNNPTGAVYNRAQLKKWVDYANDRGALILFDAAYEAFVSDPFLPRSIFEIEGAKSCAIEFCSFSKTAGFTGTRCGYTVIPKDISRGGLNLNAMWLRRQTTKFNGVSYITQRGAAAVFTPEGLSQTCSAVEYYKANARIISDTFAKHGIWHTGGINSPYIWFKCPGNMDSWSFFARLLEEAQVVGTPGSGFGKNGEGFFRFTAFGDRERTLTAMERISAVLEAKK